MGRAERARWSNNDKCRELLQEARHRRLDPEEIEQLRIGYTGYGGISRWNTDQHFTPPVVVRFIIDLLGIKEGSVLEASCGSGAFIQELPEACRVTGFELMQEAAQVAQLCNPGARIVQGNALEHLEEVEGRFDWAIGNPPFDKLARDKAPEGFILGPKSGRTEWYFVEMSYRALKPGGMLALVVPEGILGNPKDKDCRTWIMDNAWYRATIGLPPETFAFSGTSVKTSIIVVQKPLPGYRLEKEDYTIGMCAIKDIGWDSRRRETGKNDFPAALGWIWGEFGGLDARHLAKPYLELVPELVPKPTPPQPELPSLFDYPAAINVVPGEQLSLF